MWASHCIKCSHACSKCVFNEKQRHISLEPGEKKHSGAQINTLQTGWVWMSPMGAAGNDHRCNRFQSRSSSPYLWTNFYLDMLLWSNYILHIHIKLCCVNTLHLCYQHAPDLYHLFFIISLRSLTSLSMLSFTFSAKAASREKSFCSNQLFRSWMSVTPISCRFDL